MANARPTGDDEIDLFEFFYMLWDAKRLIGIFTILGTLLGVGYSQVTQPKYAVFAPFSFNMYSLGAQRLCVGSKNILKCVEAKQSFQLSSMVLGSWQLHKNEKKLSFLTTKPLDASKYEVQLERAAVAFTNKIYEEAADEVAFLKTELPEALLAAEIVSVNMLNAYRAIRMIDSGQAAATFKSVSVVRSSPKTIVLVVLSSVMGGMMGVLFTLIRSIYNKRKE